MSTEPQDNEQNDMNSLADIVERALPTAHVWTSEHERKEFFAAHLYADGGRLYVDNGSPEIKRVRDSSSAYGGIEGFKFNWRHFMFFWGIMASIAEALLIAYGRMPR